jgi:hypothetical protein
MIRILESDLPSREKSRSNSRHGRTALTSFSTPSATFAETAAKRDQLHDRLNLGPKPEGALAVEHGHIDGSDRGAASKGLQSDSDASPLLQGLPNIAESLGRAGALELVGGRLQMRMLVGKMTHTEQLQTQKDLNNQQGQFLKP